MRSYAYDVWWEIIPKYLPFLEKLIAQRALKCCNTDLSNSPMYGQVRACYIWYVVHDCPVQQKHKDAHESDDHEPEVAHKCNLGFCHSPETIRYNAWEYFYGYMKQWQDSQLCRGLRQLQQSENVHEYRNIMVGPYAEANLHQLGFTRRSLASSETAYTPDKIKWIPSIDVTRQVRRVECGRQLPRYWQSLVIAYVQGPDMLQVLEAALTGELYVQGLERKASTESENSGSYHFSWAKQHQLYVGETVRSSSYRLLCRGDEGTVYTFRQNLVSN